MIVLLLLIKFAALTELDAEDWLVLIVSPLLARTAIIALFMTTNYVREKGMGESAAQTLPKQTCFYVITGVALFSVTTALIPLAFGPDEPSIDGPSASMTMAFGVTAFATLGLGVVARRDPEATWRAPQWPYMGWVAIGPLLAWFAVELPLLQRWLDTQSLSGREWLGVLGLALVTPVAVEIGKAVRRAVERRGSGVT